MKTITKSITASAIGVAAAMSFVACSAGSDVVTPQAAPTTSAATWALTQDATTQATVAPVSSAPATTKAPVKSVSVTTAPSAAPSTAVVTRPTASVSRTVKPTYAPRPTYKPAATSKPKVTYTPKPTYTPKATSNTPVYGGYCATNGAKTVINGLSVTCLNHRWTDYNPSANPTPTKTTANVAPYVTGVSCSKWSYSGYQVSFMVNDPSGRGYSATAGVAGQTYSFGHFSGTQPFTAYFPSASGCTGAWAKVS